MLPTTRDVEISVFYLVLLRRHRKEWHALVHVVFEEVEDPSCLHHQLRLNLRREYHGSDLCGVGVTRANSAVNTISSLTKPFINKVGKRCG